MSASFLLAKQKEGKDPSKAAVGDEGVSPATILWDPPPPSPAFLPSATMSSGHEAMSKADRLTLNESEQTSSRNAGATSSMPRALGVVLAAVVLAAALISSALREPSAPPLPPPIARRRCVDPWTCWDVPAPQPQAQAVSTIRIGLLTRGGRPTRQSTEAPSHAPKAGAPKAGAPTEVPVPRYPWWGGHGPSHPWWTVWVGESAGLARRRAPARAQPRPRDASAAPGGGPQQGGGPHGGPLHAPGSLRMWRASQG